MRKILPFAAIAAAMAAPRAFAAAGAETSFAKDNLRLGEASQRGILSSASASRGSLSEAYAGAQASMDALQGMDFPWGVDVPGSEESHENPHVDWRGRANLSGGIVSGATYGFLKTSKTVGWPIIQLDHASGNAGNKGASFLIGVGAAALTILLGPPAIALGIVGGFVGLFAGPIAEAASPGSTLFWLEEP